MGFDFTFGLGNVIGSALGFASQERTNKANMKLAQYQYEKNLEMWNRENEYNTPAAQRQRMVEAGLNPNLMYGSGTVANTAASAPQYDAPKLSAYTDFGDMGVSTGLQAIMTRANKENVEANTEKTLQEKSNLATTQKLTQVETGLRQLQVTQQMLHNAKTEFEVKNMQELYDLQKREIEARIGKDAAAALVGEAQAGYVGAQTETENQSRPHKITNLKKQGVVLDTEAQKNRTQSEANKASAEASRASAVASRAAARSYEASAQKTIEEAKFLTYRQQVQLDAYVNKMIYESAIKGEHLTQEQIKTRLDQYLEASGADPRSTGYAGWIDKFSYKCDQWLNELIDLFK